jgi:hypothetical protein
MTCESDEGDRPCYVGRVGLTDRSRRAGKQFSNFQTRLKGLRRVKPCASRRLRRSLTGQGWTRLAGPVSPGGCSTPTDRRQQ